MRADRLLSLVLMLRHRGRMSAAALAAELEVSVRTVQRDIDALSAAGIPVYAERGRTGGFALLPGFTTDLTGLTTAEAVALLTARSRSGADELGIGEQFASAMRKVVAALPTAARAEAVETATRVLVRRESWLAADPGPSRAPDTIRRAVFAGHRLRIRYRAARPDARGPASGGPEWRTIDPLGLVSSAGTWYLLALRDGEDRTYRVSRIADAEELDEPAHRPDGLDLEQLWLRRRAEFRAGLDRLSVRLRVHARRWDRLSAAVPALIPTDQDGEWRTATAEFGGAGHAENVLWGLCPDVQVLAPEALRTALARRAAAVTALHAGAPPERP
jgi:predicted DNA-binding transcriptional regulator YafY